MEEEGGKAEGGSGNLLGVASGGGIVTCVKGWRLTFIFSLFFFFFFFRCASVLEVSPFSFSSDNALGPERGWLRLDNYNRIGWLGVKHRVTYLQLLTRVSE